MDPAPAFSARGQRGGWTHRRKLYYEAFDELTRWAWREFKVRVTRVAWEEASDLHRSSLLAWQADFSDNAYRHLRDVYPDLYDAVIARGRRQPIPILQRAQAAAQGAAGQPLAPVPAQPQQQPSTPSSPSSTTTVSTIKAAAPSAAPTQAAAGPGDQAAAPSAAVPTRTSSESPSRPSSFPPVKAGRGRYTAACCREVLIKEEEDATDKATAFSSTGAEGVNPTPTIQNSPQGCSSKRSEVEDQEPQLPNTSGPCIPEQPAADLGAGQLRLPDHSGGQHGNLGPPAPIRGTTRRAPHPVPSDHPYDLPDSYWHHPPRSGSSSNPPRGHGRAEHFDLSTSPPPERSAREVYSGLAAFNPDRVYEAEQVSIKRPAGRDSSTAPATKTARIVFTKRESKVKAPPQSVIDQAAADRAASKAIPPPPAPVPRAAAQRAVSVPKSISGVKRPETPPKAYKRAPPSPPPQVRFKAAPAPKLPVKQPPSAAAPSDGTPDFGVPQPDAREPIIACLDWHNTLDIAIEPDGAPKDWLFRTLAKLYRNHFPIQFRIVSYCQARETRESTLRLATQFTRVCNDSIDGLGAPPFGDVVLTWKRVGPSGKAAALAQLGASVIIDDNNATLRECRIAGALGICVERRDANRALYEALDELHEYLNQHQRLLRPARVLDQTEYLEEVGNRPHSARGGRGLFR